MEKLENSQGSFSVTALNQYGTDLTDLALKNKLDPVIGREKQIEEVIQILCKRRKNNACLTGDPGVGKTVIVEAIAQNIVNGTAPLKLKQMKVFALDMGRLVAGTIWRGDFEERMSKIVNEVKQNDGRIILFIDELHTLIGAGRASGSMDAANLLKPPLARGELKCIGATMVGEYRKYIEKDPALKRRFQTVDVPEPSIEDTVEILKGLQQKYALHHNVVYSEEALVASARLSKQYIRDGFLPDMAIDLIDEAFQLQYQKALGNAVVENTDIEYLISSKTGIPIEKVSEEESTRLLKMEKILERQMIGQDEAVKAVSRAVRRARVGLRDPNCPIASFLFTGPTGVGKTQLAKLLAAEYFGSNEAMIQIDMSEYMEKHNVAKLIGSPPGYVGHDNGGQLTEAVLRKAHSLILLDEIEKAHHDVFDIMLQLLDAGRLTDGKGRIVDFSNTIIIMTSNIGGTFVGNVNEVKKQVAEELRKRFRTEFLNRFDEIIVFKNLGHGHMRKILDVMLKQVCERVKTAKNIQVEVTNALKKRIINEGFNSNYGARPLKRAITRLLEDKLAEKILRGQLKEGDNIVMNHLD